MKLKHVFLLIGLTAAGASAQSAGQPSVQASNPAAPNLGVSMKYNTEMSRYEVFAQANFTSSRFILGPSQVTVVVPQKIADQPLDVYSETSRWTDYSSVYAPEASPDADFHGVSSMGKPIDFRANEPFMLFFFTLKGGYADGVRLFVNDKDPSSAQKGMMGGDFSNTIQNFQGKDFFRNAFSQAELAQLTQQVVEPGAPELTVYPNPVVGESFAVTASNFAPGDRVKLRLLSTSGVELYSINEDAEKLVNYRLRVPSQLAGQVYLYGERTDASTSQKVVCKKLIVSK